jgi:hypothetical protein
VNLSDNVRSGKIKKQKVAPALADDDYDALTSDLAEVLPDLLGAEGADAVQPKAEYEAVFFA